jgi:hypothetical protein
LERFLAVVDFMFSLAEFFGALGVFFPELYYRVVFVVLSWELFGYAELHRFSVLHDCEVSG